MHPILHMREWAHAHGHHPDDRMGIPPRLPHHWMQQEWFWPTVMIVGAILLMVLMIFLAVHYGPTNVGPVRFNSPYYFWMR